MTASAKRKVLTLPPGKKPRRPRVYDRAYWQSIRAQVIAEEPLCRCGCGRESTDVDHIDGNDRNMLRSNLQGLAHECHALKTARQARGSSRAMPGCDAQGTPMDARHHWNG